MTASSGNQRRKNGPVSTYNRLKRDFNKGKSEGARARRKEEGVQRKKERADAKSANREARQNEKAARKAMTPEQRAAQKSKDQLRASRERKVKMGRVQKRVSGIVTGAKEKGASAREKFSNTKAGKGVAAASKSVSESRVGKVGAAVRKTVGEKVEAGRKSVATRRVAAAERKIVRRNEKMARDATRADERAIKKNKQLRQKRIKMVENGRKRRASAEARSKRVSDFKKSASDKIGKVGAAVKARVNPRSTAAPGQYGPETPKAYNKRMKQEQRTTKKNQQLRQKRVKMLENTRKRRANAEVRKQKISDFRKGASDRIGKVGAAVRGKLNPRSTAAPGQYGPETPRAYNRRMKVEKVKGVLYRGKDKLGRVRMLRRPATEAKKAVKFGLRGAGIRDTGAVGRAIRGVDAAGNPATGSRARNLGRALGGRGNLGVNMQRAGIAVSGLEAGYAIKKANDRRTGKSKEEGGLAGDLARIGGGLAGGWAGERAGRRLAAGIKRSTRTMSERELSSPLRGRRSKMREGLGKIDKASRAKLEGFDWSKGKKISSLKAANKKDLAKKIGANVIRRGGRGGLVLGASVAGGVAAGLAGKQLGLAVDRKVGEIRRKRKQSRQSA